MPQYAAYTPSYASQSRYGGGSQGYSAEIRAPGGYSSASSRYPSSGGHGSSSRYPINSGYSTLDAQASRRREPRELRPTESKISFASAMNGLGPAPIPQGRGLHHMDSRSGLQPWERDELAESWYSGDRAVGYDLERRHPLDRASSVRHATPRSHYRGDYDSEILDSRARPSFAFDEIVRGDAARSYGLEMRGMEAFEERERQRDREMQRRIEREERKPRGFGERVRGFFR